MTEEEAFEELLSKLKNPKKPGFSILDKKRYKAAIDAANQIIDYARVNYPETEAKIEFSYITGTSLYLILRAPSFDISNIAEFCDALEVADIMCVDPVDENTIEISFVFHEVKKIYETPKSKKDNKQAK